MASAIDPTKPKDGVPAKKSDLRANLKAAKTEIEQLQTKKIGHGMPINMRGASLSRPLLRAYSEMIVEANIKQNKLNLDLAMSNVFSVTLTTNVKSFVVLNPPPVNQAVSVILIVNQDGVGGRTFTWPDAVAWPRGAAPAVSMNPRATDIYALMTINGGHNWLGFLGGQAFA